MVTIDKIKNLVANALEKAVKTKAKAVIAAYIISPIAFIMIPILVIISAIGLAEEIFYIFTESTTENNMTYKDTREGLEKVLNDMSEEQSKNLPVKKELIEKMLECEKATIRQNEVISVEYKKYKKKKKPKPKANKTTTYPKMSVTLNYYDLTYQYRLPWQLLFALTVVNEQEEDFIEEIAEKLKPKYTYRQNLNKSFYDYNDVRKLSYTNYSRTKSGRTTRYKYYPIVAVDTVETYSYRYKYKYKNVNTENGYKCEIDTIEIEDNSQAFLDVIEELDMSSADIEFLIEIIKRLPGGEMVVYELKDVLDKAGLQVDGGGMDKPFNPDVPLIEGAWSRSDLVKTAMSLQGLNYFWGGKYTKKGSNPSWGKYRTVTSAGSWATGKQLKNGLDCSGFVDWAYYQMLGRSVGHGGGTISQWKYSYAINRNDLKPGDVGFYQSGGGKHVGIYIGKLDGVDAFVHSGGRTWGDGAHIAGQVVITKQYKVYNGQPPSKFKYFRRFPIKFKDDE